MHEVPADAIAHAPEPLHMPFVPQPPWFVHIVAPGVVSAVPAATLTLQVPVAPQLVQVGQDAIPQHRPSTQLPVPHSPPLLHTAPSGFLQVPSTPHSENGARQWAFVMQLARHIVAPHTRFPGQARVICTQLPPLHVPTSVSWLPVQDAVPHAIDPGALVQVPVLQERHGPWHMASATLQHTPSTQLPLVQSAAIEHAWPFGSLSPHFFVCVLHATPGTQSLSFWQVSAHRLPLHWR